MNKQIPMTQIATTAMSVSGSVYRLVLLGPFATLPAAPVSVRYLRKTAGLLSRFLGRTVVPPAAHRTASASQAHRTASASQAHRTASASQAHRTASAYRLVLASSVRTQARGRRACLPSPASLRPEVSASLPTRGPPPEGRSTSRGFSKERRIGA
jgi:hypothetical protein